MMKVKINDELRMYLIELLNDRYYKTLDFHELQKINRLYEILGCDGETWLASMEE